jgi:hypothetical protein
LRSAFKTGVSPDHLQNVLDWNDKPFISRISVDEASLNHEIVLAGEKVLVRESGLISALDDDPAR